MLCIYISNEMSLFMEKAQLAPINLRNLASTWHLDIHELK